MWVDKSRLVLQKTSVNPDYSVALSSVGFATGVHCWVIRVDICQRLLIGVCHGAVGLDRRVNGGWGWHSHGTMSGPGQPDKEIGDYSNRDTLCFKLDMERGTLELYKNGEFKGCLTNVTGEVFAFVCMDYEGEQVSLTRRYNVIERETGMDSALDYGVVCSRTLHNVVAILNGLLEEYSQHNDMAERLKKLAAGALSSVLDQFSTFLEYLNAHAGTVGDPPLHTDSECEAGMCGVPRSSMPAHTYASTHAHVNAQAGGHTDASAGRGRHKYGGRQRSFLKVLDFVALGASTNARPNNVLNWIPSVLVFVARLESVMRGKHALQAYIYTYTH
jgi:hypothetical protein